MVSAAEFISIPYTADMTQAGITYACKSLHYTYNRMGSSAYKRLQRIVAGVGVELAFRRLLAQEDIPHDSQGATPFTDPDRYDIAIGGRRCDIKSFLITNKTRIREIRKDPRLIEAAQALVPVDQISSSQLEDEDIYIFAFLTTLLTPNQPTLEKAIQAKQPIYMIHPLPREWARPKKWASLAEIALKSNCTKTIKVELGGQNKEQAYQSEHLIIKPGVRITAKSEFYALHYINTPHLPDGEVGIYSSKLDETQIILPYQWGNIWVYGMDCIFTGYLTRKDYRQNATHLPAGSRVFQYPRTSTPNLALAIEDLHPLMSLFDQARAWQK
jgi:hypothetical protein